MARHRPQPHHGFTSSRARWADRRVRDCARPDHRRRRRSPARGPGDRSGLLAVGRRTRARARSLGAPPVDRLRQRARQDAVASGRVRAGAHLLADGTPLRICAITRIRPSTACDCAHSTSNKTPSPCTRSTTRASRAPRTTARASLQAYREEHLGARDLAPQLSRVAELGGQIAGFLLAGRWTEAHVGIVETLAVHPDHHARATVGPPASSPPTWATSHPSPTSRTRPPTSTCSSTTLARGRCCRPPNKTSPRLNQCSTSTSVGHSSSPLRWRPGWRPTAAAASPTPQAWPPRGRQRAHRPTP